MKDLKSSLDAHFGTIKDPRRAHKRIYELKDVINLAIVAMLCNCNDWVEIADYCKDRAIWLKELLGVKTGMPSHDTFARVFKILSSEAIQNSFLSWTNSLTCLQKQGVIAIDGKTMRGSGDKQAENPVTQMVSAWLVNESVVLGQKEVAAGRNEISTVPALLKQLILKDCTVTMDAAHCQSENTKLITQGAGDYVLMLKANQGKLYEDVKLTFEYEAQRGYKGVKYQQYKTQNTGHGRAESRTYTLLTEADYISHFNAKGKWWNMGSVVMIERLRSVGSQVETSVHFAISSLTQDVKLVARAIREHWTIENGLHWRLDVAFNEDLARNRSGDQAANMAVLRHIVMNLLNIEKSFVASIKRKRLKAARDNDYLFRIFNATTSF